MNIRNSKFKTETLPSGIVLMLRKVTTRTGNPPQSHLPLEMHRKGTE